MKPALFTCFCILLFNLHSNGQLKADAGTDIIVCNPEQEEYVIGGSPSAIGGVEPYKYTWSGEFSNAGSQGNSQIKASDILDDTTKSNPIVKIWDIPGEWYSLFLKVEDATGYIAYDTLEIVDASMPFNAIYMGTATIFRGDSIQLIGDPYFRQDFLPIKYLISPSHGLTDTTDVFCWTKPDSSVIYYLQAVNSVGCVSEKIRYWEIEVIDTTTNITQDLSIVTHNLQFYPNPAKNRVIISNPLNIKIKRIDLIDFSGRKIKTWELHDLLEHKLNIGNVLPGIYMLNSVTEGGIITEKLIVK